ncbi:MAG TPA: hypothetical protein VFE14_01430, partial [Micromonosporaceae bacterium]|nr:hypothetical protein [Micromonosporaceae bacterium]
MGHSSPPAADRTPGGLEMYGGQAGEHAESMVLPLDPHGPRTALPTNAGRYYVSLDGGAHWTLFNTAGESAASIQRGLATILQGADRPGGGGPRDVVVATVTRGLDADTQTTFHLGPHGWRTGETGRIASPDDLPPAPRTIEVLSPAVTDRGFAAERWTEVRRWTEPTPGRPGESSVPVSRQVTARDVEEELGYAPGGPGGRTEGYFVRTTELEGTPTDVRLFRNDGRGWEQVTADDLPHLNRDADPFGGGDGHAALLGNRDATGLSAQQLGRVTADAELQESSAAFSQRRGLEWLEQARTAGPPPESRVVPVFRVEVPDLPVPSEAALLGGGKFGAEPETLGSWLAGLLERYGLTGVRKDDPHLPSYESVAADAPPRMVDGLDYGLFKPLDHDVFKSKAPERFDPRATLGGGKNAPDAIIAEIDRIMAERRFLAETGTGGEARPTTDPPRSAGDEVSVPPAQPSLRSQAIDAMARHEEMVEYSQSGLRPSAGGEVPSGSVAGGGGRPYGTIRDELIAAGNKPGLPPRAAQESYARNLSLGELRAGLEGVVHERRDLLVAQASGRPYDIVGTTAGKAGASPDADQVAALTSTRLQQLDGVEAALYRAWESRLGASPPAVRTPPSTQAEGRAAVEAELARLVQLRRQEFSPLRPAGADAVDSDLLASIVEAESALLQKTRGIEEQALQANVTSATSDLAAAARALTDVVARFKAAGGRAHVGGGEGQVVSQVKQAAERFDELTLEAYRAHLAVQSAQEQLSGVFGPPSWAVAAGTISAPDASVVTYHDAAVSKAPMSFGERARTLLAGALASAAGSNSLVPVGSGYVLRGPGPDGATPPPLTDEDLRAAQLAPAINGAVRIMPDVRALAGLEKVVRSLPPWLKYRVVPDLRLIPVDADLPFSPKSFAARNFVHVDVPVRAVKAPDPA